MCADLVVLKTEIIKISSALIRPKWAYKQQAHISSTYFACPKEAAVRREKEPKEQRSDGSETRSSKEGLSDPFRRRQSELFGSRCFVLIFGIVLPAWAGSILL